MPYSIPRRIWRIIYPALLYVSISLVVGLLVGIAIGIYAGAVNREDVKYELFQMVNDNPNFITLIAGLVRIAIFLPLWLKTRKYIERYKNSSFSATALLTVGAFAGLNLLIICAISMMNLLRFFPSYESVNNRLLSGTLISQILVLGITAPVVEELCFRGILLNRMRWMPAWVAVLTQGALFALAHMNIFQGLYAFVAGVLLAVIYLRFRSVTLAIVGHMSFNLASIMLNSISAKVPLSAILSLTLSVTAVCMFLLFRRPKAELIEGDALIL